MRKIAACALALMLLLCLSLPMTHADVGNFAGDSDWGDSDWGDSDWSSDYDSGSDYDSDGEAGDFGTVLWTVVAIFAVAIIFSVKEKIDKKKGNTSAVRVSEPVEQADLTELMARDPDFDQDKFLENVGNLYVQMQKAWTARKWEPMRAHLTDAFYNQLAHQLDEMIQAGQTNHVDRISVLSTVITGYECRDNLDVLKVRLSTRICDYTTKDATGAVVSGDKNRELFMTYEWTMVRSMNAVTKSDEGARACPNCGAPLDANASSKCPYCGTVIIGTDYDWTLSAIRGISQRSN